jgi:hypothetical protein
MHQLHLQPEHILGSQTSFRLRPARGGGGSWVPGEPRLSKDRTRVVCGYRFPDREQPCQEWLAWWADNWDSLRWREITGMSVVGASTGPVATRAESFAERFGMAGVSVRCFKGEGVRITIGAPTANDRVVDVGRSFAFGMRARSAARPATRETRRTQRSARKGNANEQ